MTSLHPDHDLQRRLQGIAGINVEDHVVQTSRLGSENDFLELRPYASEAVRLASRLLELPLETIPPTFEKQLNDVADRILNLGPSMNADATESSNNAARSKRTLSGK